MCSPADMAKPAVPFGGKFRIIDFPLSNCTNSGIDTVGVLTQYRPLELNTYIGSGQPWELDRMNGGVHILPPYQSADRRHVVQGHRQRHLPEHRLRGSVRPGVCADPLRRPHLQDGLLRHAAPPQGDGRRLHHLRDGGALGGGQPLRHHVRGRRGHHHGVRRKAQGAQEQSGVHGHLRVHMEEAAGVSDRRTRPTPPPTTTSARTSSPPCCTAGEKMVAYRFEGYWKDVGTLDSLWDANMDMLSPGSGLNLLDKKLAHLRPHARLPAHLHRGAGRRGQQRHRQGLHGAGRGEEHRC